VSIKACAPIFRSRRVPPPHRLYFFLLRGPRSIANPLSIRDHFIHDHCKSEKSEADLLFLPQKIPTRNNPALQHQCKAERGLTLLSPPVQKQSHPSPPNFPRYSQGNKMLLTTRHTVQTLQILASYLASQAYKRARASTRTCERPQTFAGRLSSNHLQQPGKTPFRPSQTLSPFTPLS
jgi:hypothetical protein